jgi:hypothetical protein
MLFEHFHFTRGVKGAHPLGLPPPLGEREGHPRKSEKFEAPDKDFTQQELSEMNSGYHTIAFFPKTPLHYIDVTVFHARERVFRPIKIPSK